MIKSGDQRIAEPICGGEIDLPGYRHDQRYTRRMRHAPDGDSQQLHIRRIPLSAEIIIGSVTTRALHVCTISKREQRQRRRSGEHTAKGRTVAVVLPPGLAVQGTVHIIQ